MLFGQVEAKLERFLSRHELSRDTRTHNGNSRDSVSSPKHTQEAFSTARVINPSGKQVGIDVILMYRSRPMNDSGLAQTNSEVVNEEARELYDGSVELQEGLLLPPTTFPPIRGLPQILYSHVLQHAVLPPTTSERRSSDRGGQ